MTDTASQSARFLLAPMRPRDVGEPNRAASTLELFFDLVFAIAVSRASTSLFDLLAEGDWAHGLPRYLLAFFPIWWAWMNFTWFSTSFDDDDWLYRFLAIVQMGGVLLFASGIEPMFVEDSYTLMIAGYVVMRVAMVMQWLRATASGGPTRRTALIYAAGIAVAQVLWVAWLFVPDSPARTAFLAVLILCEIAVPVVAESAGHASTPGIRNTSLNGTGALPLSCSARVSSVRRMRCSRRAATSIPSCGSSSWRCSRSS